MAKAEISLLQYSAFVNLTSVALFLCTFEASALILSNHHSPLFCCVAKLRCGFETNILMRLQILSF